MNQWYKTGMWMNIRPRKASRQRLAKSINPRSRYEAMEQHFAATGRAASGAVMMNSTAALQLNLQAGPKTGWPARVQLAHRLGPTLVAIAAAALATG